MNDSPWDRAAATLAGLACLSWMLALFLPNVTAAGASLCGMVGWAAFALSLCFAIDVRFEKRWQLPEQAQRIVGYFLLAAISLGFVLFHSKLNSAGVHGDLIYTYSRLDEIIRLESPLNYTGETPSYPQPAGMFLIHLPIWLLGGTRYYSTYAPLLGSVLAIALLAALFIERVTAGRRYDAVFLSLVLPLAIANRFNVYIFNMPWYGLIGLALAAIIFEYSAVGLNRDVCRRVYLLSACGVALHMAGLFYLAPLAVGLVILAIFQRQAPQRQAAPFLAVIVLFVLSSVVEPSRSIFGRVKDVMAANTVSASLPARIFNGLVTRSAEIGAEFGRTLERLVISGEPSWHFLGRPHLGLGALIIVVFTLVVAFLHLPARARIRLGIGMAYCICSATLMETLTSPSGYRHSVALFSLLTIPWLFIAEQWSRAQPPLRRNWRNILLFAAFFNVVDIPVPAGDYLESKHGDRSYDALRPLMISQAPKLPGKPIWFTKERYFSWETLFPWDYRHRDFDFRSLFAIETCFSRRDRFIDRLLTDTSDSVAFVHNEQFCELRDPLHRFFRHALREETRLSRDSYLYIFDPEGLRDLRNFDRRHRSPEWRIPFSSEGVAIGEAITMDAHQDWGRATMDRSVLGNPFQYGERIFQRGIGIHANSRIRFSLAGKYRQLRVTVVAGESGDGGPASIVFRIRGDARELWSSGLRSEPWIEQVEVDLSDVDQLDLIVEDGGNGIAFDHAAWLDPDLVPK